VNASVTKDLISQLIVVMGVCVGAWMLFVEPKAVALAEREAEIAAGRARLMAADFDRLRKVASRAPGIRESAAEIEARSELARDSAGLYSRIMQLAQGQNILVRNLQPRAGEGGADADILVTRIDMKIEGDYQQLADFVESLRSVEAYLRVASLSLVPIDSEEVKRATMQMSCEALAFRIPPDLLHLGEEKQ
jgi:Tfp pilus assembly protein PilO